MSAPGGVSAWGGVCSGGCLLLGSLLPGGGSAPWGCAPGGLLLGSVSAPRGESAPRGTCSGGCLLQGMGSVCSGGCLLLGGLLPGGSAPWGCALGGLLLGSVSAPRGSLLPGVPALGGVCSRGWGVSALGRCLLLGGLLPGGTHQGVSAPGGCVSAPGGCLLWGMSALGRVSAPRGVCS